MVWLDINVRPTDVIRGNLKGDFHRIDLVRSVGEQRLL
jgi:hypothetical protein